MNRLCAATRRLGAGLAARGSGRAAPVASADRGDHLGGTDAEWFLLWFRLENQLGGHHDCRFQTSIHWTLVGEDGMYSFNLIAVNLTCLELQPHMNSPYHQNASFQFDFTNPFPYQPPA